MPVNRLRSADSSFAFSRESGLREDYKQSLLQKAARGEIFLRYS